MYLQGDLQLVFDALFDMGVIDPVLEKDWSEALDELPSYYDTYTEVLKIANDFQSDKFQMMEHLEKFDEETLGYLAMEVAKEFADFHSREELH